MILNGNRIAEKTRLRGIRQEQRILREELNRLTN